MSDRRLLPASATPASQVRVGLAALLVGGWAVFGLAVFGDPAQALPSQAAVAFLVLWLGGCMTAHDLLWLRSYQSNLLPVPAATPLRGRAARVLRKWLGLHAVLAAWASVYWVFEEYHGGLYAPFFTLCRAGWPWWVLVSLPYIAWVDARMAQPHDAYWHLGDALLSLRWPGAATAGPAGPCPGASVAWQSFALGWGVKAFFLPLMWGYAVRQVQAVAALPSPAIAQSPLQWFEWAMATLYFIDVIWGAMGYLWSLRLTDSHVRSTEPTTLGWLAALVCYEPLSRAVFPAYFAYGSGPAWGHWLADRPALELLWAALIVALTGVYAAATVSFGLRFSNLTHRGIVTSGPYRWLRHPAYVSKNLSWWLISMPFMVHTHWTDSLRLCAMLLAVNGVYWLRARTEDRHLRQDPVYRAYADALLARRRRALAGLGRLVGLGRQVGLVGLRGLVGLVGRGGRVGLAARAGQGASAGLWALARRANWGRLRPPFSSPAP